MLKIQEQWTGLILASFMLAGPGAALAWDNETTHRALSDVAAQRSVLVTGYLENGLGITDGLNTSVDWVGGKKGTKKRLREWILDGADFEDDGSVLFNGRFYNHFHNPLHQQPWADAGLSDLVLSPKVSALLWAQNAGVSDQSNTDWSWQVTRQYFYLALTAQTKPDRDAALAQTFVGLGHQIHLVQDMAQPSHVRNDAHPGDAIADIPFLHWLERLETWTKRNQDVARGFMNQPAVFPTVDFNTSWNGLAPITALWDTDAYMGTASIPVTVT